MFVIYTFVVVACELLKNTASEAVLVTSKFPFISTFPAKVAPVPFKVKTLELFIPNKWLEPVGTL